MTIPASCPGKKAGKQLIFSEVSNTSPSLPLLFPNCFPAGDPYRQLRNSSFNGLSLAVSAGMEGQ
jgi:hypothetical protein